MPCSLLQFEYREFQTFPIFKFKNIKDLKIQNE